MSAYLIGNISVKQENLWQQYVAAVRESLLPFAATTLFRGRQVEVLAGAQQRNLVVVIEFTDHTTLKRWFSSAHYQALIPLRDQAADVVITTYTT